MTVPIVPGRLGLDAVCETVLLASTAPYVVRRLRADPVVLTTARSFEGTEIARSLDCLLDAGPLAGRDQAAALVLLVALAEKGADRAVERYASMSRDRCRWLAEVAGFLSQAAATTGRP